MRERSMTEIMQQRGGKYGSPVSFINSFSRQLLHTSQEPARVVHDANRVRESAVIRAWKNHFCHSELLDPPEPLELGGVDEIEQEPVARGVLKRDDLVYRVPNQLGPRLSHSPPANKILTPAWVVVQGNSLKESPAISTPPRKGSPSSS